MLSAAINTAITGLNASKTRLSVSGNNVANLQSTSSNVNGKTVLEPYRAQEVQQSALQPGVRATVRDRDPATIKVYDPDNIAADAEGITEYPNVSLEQEVIDQQFSSYSFKANARVIDAADKMTGSLLDIFA